MTQILGRYGQCLAWNSIRLIDKPGIRRDNYSIAALYPIIYLNATAALANVDPAMEEAAANLAAAG